MHRILLFLLFSLFLLVLSPHEEWEEFQVLLQQGAVLLQFFVRSNRGVEFTPEGKEFLSYAV